MRRVLLVLAALLAATCGSVDLGDLGEILGSRSADRPSDVSGIVRNVDVNDRRIDLDVQYINQLRQTNQTGSIYWDSQTRVEYQGQTYRPESLERGDQIRVRGHNAGGRYVAEVITVTYDATR